MGTTKNALNEKEMELVRNLVSECRLATFRKN